MQTLPQEGFGASQPQRPQFHMSRFDRQEDDWGPPAAPAPAAPPPGVYMHTCRDENACKPPLSLLPSLIELIAPSLPPLPALPLSPVLCAFHAVPTVAAPAPPPADFLAATMAAVQAAAASAMTKAGAVMDNREARRLYVGNVPPGSSSVCPRPPAFPSPALPPHDHALRGRCWAPPPSCPPAVFLAPIPICVFLLYVCAGCLHGVCEPDRGAGWHGACWRPVRHLLPRLPRQKLCLR